MITNKTLYAQKYFKYNTSACTITESEFIPLRFKYMKDKSEKVTKVPKAGKETVLNTILSKRYCLKYSSKINNFTDEVFDTAESSLKDLLFQRVHKSKYVYDFIFIDLSDDMTHFRLSSSNLKPTGFFLILLTFQVLLLFFVKKI